MHSKQDAAAEKDRRISFPEPIYIFLCKSTQQEK